MYNWPKIGSFKDAAHYASKFEVGPITYTGTIKLHGTNAGVHFTKDGLVPQSRNRALSVKEDNLGFATWVHSDIVEATLRVLEDELRSFFRIPKEDEIVVFGEWCGKGVQKGVAISQLPSKQWVLFGAHQIKDRNATPLDLLSFYEAHKKATKTREPFYDVMSVLRECQIYFIYEGGTWNITFDFDNLGESQMAFDQIQIWTQEVEDCCPWGSNFEIKGVGEGIVWQSSALNPNLTFKSKGRQHKISSVAKTCIENVPNVSEFLVEFLTEERMSQGISYLEEMGYPITLQSLPHFLKWVGNDIKTEGSLRLAELNLSWKDVSKLINQEAVKWYKNREG